MEEKSNIQISIEKFGYKHQEIKLEKSTISDCDITELEMKLGITIPSTVKDYFRSYTLSTPFVVGRTVGDFSKTYCEETGRWRELEIEEEIATQILHLPLMFPDFDLSEFENINCAFAGTGYLWLGTYNDDDYNNSEYLNDYKYYTMGKTGSKPACDVCRVSITDNEKVNEIVYGNPREGCKK